MRVLPALRAVLWIATFSVSTASAQTTEYLIDFGDEDLTTGAQAQVWNDVTAAAPQTAVPLVDSSGTATFVNLTVLKPLGRSELTGVQVPDPGSELEQVGWPISAISDSMVSDSLSTGPEAELMLSGLDPLATYDFSILVSVLGGNYSLTTEYTTFGADVISTIGEPAENTSTLQHLRGIRPRVNGTLNLLIRYGTTNTSPTRLFYINALSMVEHAAGTQPPLLGFDTSRLDASRAIGTGTVRASLSLYTNNDELPWGDLLAVDTSTGLAPTWLAMPGSAEAEVPFDVLLDPSALAPGTYTAQLLVTSEGYVSDSMQIVFAARVPGRLNLIYFGNSYTNANGTVHELVDRLAEEAGLDVPMSVPRLSSGKKLAFHLQANQVTAISRSLPLGEEWDVVIIQGGTVEATAVLGNRTKYVTNGLAVMGNVRAHSPGVRAVVFQTWARGAGHSYYQGSAPTYPGPLDMHLDLEAGNEQLAAAITATYEAGSATVSEIGETMALRGFDAAYYKQDLSHPQPVLTAQAAAAMFSTIYGLPSCDLQLDFETPGPVAAHLAGIGLDEDDWNSVSGIADRAGEPELRPYPGSGEDFLLTSGAPGLLTACSEKSHPAGIPLRFELTSPAGSFGAPAAMLYFDVVGHEGGSTVVPPWSEVHITSTSFVQAVTTALGSGGLSTEIALPIELIGQTLLVQGASEGISLNTGHNLTLSDAHAVTVLPPGKQPPATNNP